MRKISIIFFTTLLMVSTSVLANETVVTNPEKNLCSQIHNLLKKNSLKVESGELTALVRLTLNRNGELVVLSVETKDRILEGFLKSKLNYQKVELQRVEEGRIYTVPVRVTA